MAEENIDEEPIEESPEKKPPKNRLVMFLVVCVGLLLLAFGLAAGYIIGQANSPRMLAGDPLVTGNGNIEETAEEEAAEEPVEEEELAEAIYKSLRPEFTVNFHDGQKERYLMASIEVMARNQEVLDRVDQDMPVVRYQILRVLGRQDQTLFEEGGKDRLLTQILEAVQGVVDSPAGNVEAVYLTSFVVQ